MKERYYTQKRPTDRGTTESALQAAEATYVSALAAIGALTAGEKLSEVSMGK